MASASCLVCVYYSTVDISHFFSPVRPCCPHSKANHYYKPKFKISRVRWTVVFLVAVAFLCLTIPGIPDLVQTCKSDKALCLIIVSDEFFSTASLITVIKLICNLGKYCEEMEAWCDFVLCGKIYGLNNVIGSKTNRKLVAIRNRGIYVICAMVVYLLTIYFGFSWYDYLSWNVARKMVLLLCSCLQLYVVLEFLHRFVIAGSVLDAMKRALRKKRCFSKHVHAISAINGINRLADYMITACLITWTLTGIVFLILNIAALFDHAFMSVATILLVQTKAIFSGTMIVTMFHMHDTTLKSKVSY